MPAITIKFLALLLLLVGLESQALTLGRVQGAALIGRILDVSIPVQMDPGQSISSACFEADVFHGDTRQDPAQVQVRLEPTTSVETVRLRIVSQSPIDEPVVTIYVRAGCAQMVTRRYVMLADIVSEQAAPIVSREVAALPRIVVPASTGAGAGARAGADSGAVVAAAPRSNSTSAPDRAVRDSATAGTAPVKRVRPRAAPVEPARPKAVAERTAPAAASAGTDVQPARKLEQPAAGQAAGQSRLKLDPLELLSERVATLESTTTGVQTQAAARDAQRLDSLEASIKTLVALAARNEASLLEIRSRLQQAQDDRYSNPVIYLLAALLLASLLAIAYLLTRRQRQMAAGENWWDESGQAEPAPRPVQPPQPDSGPAQLTSPAVLSQPDSLPSTPQRLEELVTQPLIQRPAARSPATTGTQVDVSLVEMSESTFDLLMQSGAQHNAVRKAPVVAPTAQQPIETGPGGVETSRRMRINSDELIDIRQRAEFFVTLGQTDQAVQILENRIAQDGESSPQAYLDLLKLFHALGLRADYRQVCSDFGLLFNVKVPEFAQFASPSRVLEEYPSTIDSLIAVWETDEVLDTIEGLLFRGESDQGQEAFELEAFRDLLILHAIAQSLRSGVEQPPGAARTSFPELDAHAPLDINLSALAPFDQTQGARAVDDGSLEPALPSLRAGNLIDFDLSEIPLDKPSDRS